MEFFFQKYGVAEQFGLRTTDLECPHTHKKKYSHPNQVFSKKFIFKRPSVNFIKVKRANFLYKRRFGSFFPVTCT